MNKSRSGPAKSGATDFVNPVASVFAGKLDIKLNKGFLKAQAKFNDHQASRNKAKIISNIKNKICYTCRQKGHLVVVSPRTGTKAIWVPKSLFSNIVGPNTCWVPKRA